MMNTGIEACEQLKEVCFSGNIIPQIWYKVFVKKELKHPKPHLLAINILSDIVYWYRPSEVRDESTGQLTGYKKKFGSDMLQRSYNQFAELFGCSCGQAKEAVVFLEKMGVIKRVFRDLTANGIALNNVLFLDLNVKCLKELTYPENAEDNRPAKSNTENAPQYEDVPESQQGCAENSTEGVSKFHRRGIANFDGGVPEFQQTNTETTQEINPEITLSSPSYSPKPGKKAARTEDKIGEVSEFMDSIGLDQLRHKEMAEPVKMILSDLLLTGKVGRNQFRREDIKKTLSFLSANEIDTVIDRFTVQRKKVNIPCPDDYLKACLLKAGRSAEYLQLSGKSGTEGIHCGNPSYDIDEYVRLSMKVLHGEG